MKNTIYPLWPVMVGEFYNPNHALIKNELVNFFVNKDGTPYILEINMNCGVYFEPDAYGSADFCIALEPDGHVGFTKKLVDAAFFRHNKEQ